MGRRPIPIADRLYPAASTLPLGLIQWLDQYAVDEGCTRAEVIRRAIETFRDSFDPDRQEEVAATTRTEAEKFEVMVKTLIGYGNTREEAEEKARATIAHLARVNKK